MLAAFLLAGCSDPKSYKVAKLTEAQKKEIGQKLTAAEGLKLTGWMMLRSMSGKDIPDDFTVGQALKEQDEWIIQDDIRKAREAEAKKISGAKEEELKKQAAEMKKQAEIERQAKLDEIASLVSVALIAKKNKEHEYNSKFVFLELVFENKSDKDIQGIKGVLTITDIFGDKIKRLTWSYDKGIKAKQKAIETDHGVDINHYINEDQKLWSTDFDKLKSSYKVATIIFKDGSKIDAPDQE